MIKLFPSFLFLFLATPLVSEVSFARLIKENSFAKDRFFGGIEINLQLSQGVPYKIWMDRDPLSLIIDFNVLNFNGIDLEKINQSKNIKSIEIKELDTEWSRLSFHLADYWAIENTEMSISPQDNSASLSIFLKSISEGIFSLTDKPNKDFSSNKISAIENNDFVVVLDPGHGGRDPGAEAGGYRESSLMLELAETVKESLIRNTDFKVVLTRTEDKFLSLEDRITIASQSDANLFISLHADAVIEGEASGTTVYLLSDKATDKMSAQLASRHDRSEILRGVDLSGLDSQVASVLLDMARQETKPRSEAVASFILKVFKEKITELSSQPLRYAAFSVLKSPDIPSILIEAGFMSTSSDLQNLTTKKWRREFADSLTEAISRWHVRDKENKVLLRE
ncbi:MAG: N-acetylmuramoyl-L-alanine amidase [Rhodobacterales bacterium]|nr:N-acetylmuramoyl-L-alanine amidase [Rhodobacterales bacterium]